jgi:nicotinamide mononucleotide transporter
MTLIEIIAVVFSFLSVILAIKRSILNWSIGIVGIIFYFFVFLKDLLYSNMILQIIYLGQSIYGIYEWTLNKKKIDKPVQMGFINWNFKSVMQILIYFIFSNDLMIMFFNQSKFYIFDSVTTSLSILAFYLLAKGKIENWIIWILVDIMYIYLFLKEKLYLSSVLYLIFLFLCVKGLIEWKKSYKNETIRKS